MKTELIDVEQLLACEAIAVFLRTAHFGTTMCMNCGARGFLRSKGSRDAHDAVCPYVVCSFCCQVLERNFDEIADHQNRCRSIHETGPRTRAASQTAVFLDSENPEQVEELPAESYKPMTIAEIEKAIAEGADLHMAPNGTVAKRNGQVTIPEEKGDPR